jgi:hypothetical protein
VFLGWSHWSAHWAWYCCSKAYFTYYLVLVIPRLVIVFVVAMCGLAQGFTLRWRPLLVSGTLILGLVVPVVYDEVYFGSGTFHVAPPAKIIPVLRQTDGSVYSMYPLFALWSGRPEYPWRYSTVSMRLFLD